MVLEVYSVKIERSPGKRFGFWGGEGSFIEIGQGQCVYTNGHNYRRITNDEDSDAKGD